MNQLQTRGIILARTDFGEADRILTVLTPEQGKLRLMAKGVRRLKSKMAGGIELFSVSDITYIRGKGDIGTLISSRLFKHYGHIVKDIGRVQLGYQILKQLNKATEDEPEAGYFRLAEQALIALDSADIDTELIELWFQAQLLKLSGHTLNLTTDTNGQKLQATGRYNFDFETTAFSSHPDGNFQAGDIKALRLFFSDNQPEKLNKVEGLQRRIRVIQPLLGNIFRFYVRI